MTTATYISCLPDEVKIKIFSYLETYDMIQFCNVFPSLRYILYDKDVNSTVEFCKEFRLHLEDLNDFISDKWDLSKIISLNINGVYWIPGRFLLKCIVRLPQLKNLYAIDTELGFSSLDCSVYNKCDKLNALALSVKDDYFYTWSKWPKIKHIYLYVNTSVHNTYYFVKCLRLKIKSIERIWTFRERVFFPRAFHLVNVQNVVDQHLRPEIHLEGTETLRNSLVWNGAVWKQFLNRFNGTDRTFWSIENLPASQFLPFGIKDVENLCKRKYNLETIKYNELNFFHVPGECAKNFNEFSHSVLTLPNAKYLRKLAISFCICQGKNSEENVRQPSVKRPRLSYEENNCQCTFLAVTEKCHYVEELEIWKCSKVTSHCSSINNIANFKLLKKLSLIDIPFHMGGRFLINVVKCCKHLEFLSIKTTSVCRSFHKNLCLALQSANSLKDLRYEQTYLPLHKLFVSLNAIKNSQLQRVFVKCDTADKFNIKSLENFLKMHSRLVFLFIVVNNLATEDITTIQNLMNKYKKNPQKIFYTTKHVDECIKSNFIPSVHKIDMIELVTKVSVYNHFENCNI